MQAAYYYTFACHHTIYLGSKLTVDDNYKNRVYSSRYDFLS